MKDTHICPICSDRLKNKELKNCTIPDIPGVSEYIQRTCKKGIGHFFQILVDTQGNVQNLLVTLDYNKTIRLNYRSNFTILFLKASSSWMDDRVFMIPKLLETDFPKLEKLREKLSLYAIFS